jgi:hypothetical protein
MNGAAETSSGAIIYIPGFLKNGSGVRKLIGRDTQTQKSGLISLLTFFQNKESRLKTIDT